MAQDSKKITCPNCGFEIDVNEIVYHQLEEKLKRQFNAEVAEVKRAVQQQEETLQLQRRELEQERRALQQKVDADVTERLEQETEKLTQKLFAEAEQAQSQRISSLEQELTRKSEQVKELNRSKAEIERLRREKDELKEAIEAESEKKLTEALRLEKDRIRKDEENKALLKISEREQLIEQLRKQLSDAQRRAEEGSSQNRGEAQELVIEQWLRETFPLDTIEEIKKGAQGADCLQIVNSRAKANCGTIYYESKRTRAFQPAWIEKFKNDIRDKRADIGVLITETMPSDMQHMGLREGVWICSFDEFRGLAAVLRDTVIRLSNASAAVENRGTKMEMLYDYLTGTEFRLQIEAIVEGFSQMQQDLEAEKRAIQSQWKKREKQIEKVLLSTTNMHGSIRGIAGNAVQPVRMLELTDQPSEDGENQ